MNPFNISDWAAHLLIYCALILSSREQTDVCKLSDWHLNISHLSNLSNSIEIFHNNKKIIIFEYFRFVFGIEQTFIFFTALLELFCKKEFEIVANLILFWLFEQFVLIYIVKLMFVWLKDYIKQNCPSFKCSLHWTKKPNCTHAAG